MSGTGVLLGGLYLLKGTLSVQLVKVHLNCVRREYRELQIL